MNPLSMETAEDEKIYMTIKYIVFLTSITHLLIAERIQIILILEVWNRNY